MSKFKVGDRVRIRKDLKPYRRYGNTMLAPEMAECLGAETEVIKIYEHGSVLLVSNSFRWSLEMLEPIAGLKKMTREQKDKLHKLAMDVDEAGVDVVINYQSRTNILDIWIYSPNTKVAFGYAFHTDQPLDTLKYKNFVQEMEKILEKKQ